MSDDVSDIRDYYATQIEREEERLNRHQLERDLTRRYLSQHLPASGRILEIGAATGAYTQWLAEQGYRVTAVDLTPAMLAYNRQRTEAAGLLERVSFVEADVRELPTLAGEPFDAVLMMGPLYHLIERQDRALALRQACAKLVNGGVLATTWISRFGIFGDLMKQMPGWIEKQKDVRSVIERGRDPEDYPRGAFRGYFARVDEIIPEHEAQGLQTIRLAGVEPCISADDESYNRLEGIHRQLWQDLLFEFSQNPQLTASSRHILYIGRKPI
jgi:SAM-dependent methyltransferase